MGRISVAVVLLVLATVPLMAQSESQQPKAKDVETTVDSTVQIHRGTQKMQDDWAQEKAELVARYKTAKANVQYLSERRAIQEKESAALDAGIAELERRLEESRRLEHSLQDTLITVLDRLEEWVARDLPFAMREREARVASLREMVVRPDVEGSEKLRRILEALEIETGYGLSVEVDQQRIEVGGEELFVDVLRLGRISLYWRTPDGSRIGEYDQGTGKWVELPSKYNRSIQYTMEMASRIRPVEVINLPLGRIQP
jgi:hypothetical protein